MVIGSTFLLEAIFSQKRRNLDNLLLAGLVGPLCEVFFIGFMAYTFCARGLPKIP